MNKSSLLVLIGAVLILGGGYVLVEGGYITSRKQVVDFGGLQVTATERNRIEPWMAGIALIAGTALVIGGLTRKV
jgi:hypothetical protein